MHVRALFKAINNHMPLRDALASCYLDETGLSQLIARAQMAFREFPSNAKEDAQYTQSELQQVIEAFRVISENWASSVARAILQDNSLAFADKMFWYFARNGPTAPVAAFEVTASLVFRNGQAYTLGYDWVLIVMETILERITVLPGEDCARMLDHARLMFSVTLHLKTQSRENPLYGKQWEYFKQLLQICETASSTMEPKTCVALYRFASGFGKKNDINDELLDIFLSVDYTDETKLQVATALMQEHRDKRTCLSKILSCGVQAARRLPQNEADELLFALHLCLDLNRRDNVKSAELLTTLPEVAIHFIEDKVRVGNLKAVDCMLDCVWMIVHLESTLDKPFDKLSKDVIEEMKIGFVRGVIEFFSEPFQAGEFVLKNGPMFALGIYDLTKCEQEWTEPLLKMFTSQVVDARFTWFYRKLIFEEAVKELPKRPSALRETLLNNVLWLKDKSRYAYNGDNKSEQQAAQTMMREVQYYKPTKTMLLSSIPLILLLTWLRAPAIVERLRTQSKLSLLCQDLLRRLAVMLGGCYYCRSD